MKNRINIKATWLFIAFLFLLVIAMSAYILKLRGAIFEQIRVSKSVYDNKVAIMNRKIDLSEYMNGVFLRYLGNSHSMAYSLERQKTKYLKLYEDGYFFEKPFENQIFQRLKNKGNIHFNLNKGRFSKLSVGLRQPNSKKFISIKNTSSGEFKNVSNGVYEICAIETKGNVLGCQKTGIGDVFIVAGQSNAGSPAKQHPPMNSKSGMVFATMSAVAGGMIRVIDLKQRSMDSNIAWIYAGEEITKKLKIPILFINIAAGSSSTKLWAPQTEYLFRRLHTILRTFKAKAVLWHQGESDCGEGLEEKDSYNNMKEMISQAKEIQNIPWVVAINSDINIRKDCPIRNAQRRIISDQLALKGPDTDKIKKGTEKVPDAEFIGEKIKDHGFAWLKYINKYFYQ